MKNISRIGQVSISLKNQTMTIVECFSARNITVKFEDGTIVNKIQVINFLKGSVKNPMFPILADVGFFGIGKYSYKIHTKSYQAWADMLKRCYGDREANPSYEGCTVHEDWHNFQNFAAWFEKNYKSYMDSSWKLDKDIIVPRNKIYSSTTCIYVPNDLSSEFKKKKNKFGEYNIFCKREIKNKEHRVRVKTEKHKSLLEIKIYKILINYQYKNYV